MSEFLMPSLGADMEAGTVYDWRVKPGDRVQRGDIIASVETDKGVIDVEVYIDGVVQEILVQEGENVPVGTALALIQAEGEAAAVVEKAPETTVPPLEPEEPHPMDQRPLVGQPATNGKPAQHSETRVRISPRARKLAAELHVDLSRVQGTGPGGAIQEADVQQAAAAEAAPTARVSPVARRMAQELDVDLSGVTGTGPHGVIQRADVERFVAAMMAAAPEPELKETTVAAAAVAQPTATQNAESFQAGMRRAIARAMARANRDIPHYYLETRIDMSAALRWLEAENQQRSIKDRVLPAVLLIKAVAKALGDVPELNGFWVDDQLQVQEAIHIGFAIALRQGGLVTPAIHNADMKSLDELMAALRDLITRTRSGRLRSSELMDATITLTNLGDIGVEKVFGVIYPPQVALVGFGKVTEQVWVDNGMIGVRPVLVATLAGDHRATDGRRGGQFLDALTRYLHHPETWE